MGESICCVPWSKVVHYIGNRGPFRTHPPKSDWTVGVCDSEQSRQSFAPVWGSVIQYRADRAFPLCGGPGYLQLELA